MAQELKAPENKASMLAARMRKNYPDTTTAADSVKSWKFVDFCDPRHRRPFLAVEWLFGSRGLLAGRIINLIATYSKGKSSFMYFMYACAQRLSGGAWCCHMETEGSPAPPDFIASYGADPNDMLVANETSLEECMAWIDESEANVRGQWGEAVDPVTGKKVKSKFTDPLDPDCNAPIVLGVDSLSSLGIQEKVEVDVTDKTKTAQPGVAAKKLREYLRERVGRFKRRYLLMMLASHETKKIDMKGGMQAKGADVTSLAREAIGIHATYEVLVNSKPWREKEAPYTQHGDIITLQTTKNKVSPRGRQIDLYLRTEKGFDCVETDVEWLLYHAASPFVNPLLTPVFGTISKYGSTIKCPLLQEKAFPTREAFLAALYARTDIVQAMREALRIRGFGFKFETDFGPTGEIAEDEDPVEEAPATAEQVVAEQAVAFTPVAME